MEPDEAGVGVSGISRSTTDSVGSARGVESVAESRGGVVDADSAEGEVGSGEDSSPLDEHARIPATAIAASKTMTLRCHPHNCPL